MSAKRALQSLIPISKKGLILHLITATGILRNSFKKHNQKDRTLYKKNAVRVIERLLAKVDNDTLTNTAIQKSISELAGGRWSVGLAQKSINVVLKYYCLARGEKLRMLKELDCPIDSGIIREYYKQGYNRPNFRLVNLDAKSYKAIQKLIRKKKDIKILADLSYEKRYIKSALK